MTVKLNHTIVHARGLAYCADPGGHFLEIITRPYGSGA
jgi:hypothetical protein